MTKLDGKTPDLAAENIEQLRQIFPDVFEEGKIDFDKLKQVLGEYVDDEKERYNFTWNGKGKALRLAQTPTTGTLRPCPEEGESKNWNDTQNLYIEGDNLEVLKLLQKSYHGKIKMIYIDPPYNTGEDFIYPDNFVDSIENYKLITGQVGEDGKRLSPNTESNGRFHTDWLNMLFPRLRLARNLLSNDGIIFISANDKEVDNTRKICDEIFGNSSFLATFIWEKRTNRENRKLISVRHDYIVCYCKNSMLKAEAIGQLPMDEEALSRYSNPDNDPRGDWKSDPAHAQAGHGTKGQFYTLIAPNGTKHELPSGRCWVYTQDVMEQAIKDGRIWFGHDGNNVPRIKTYLTAKERGLTPETILFAKDVSTNEIAKTKLKELFDGISLFETPKPVELLKSIMNMAQKDITVLDFFSGSATTAHAVMQLNAEDGGSRKFIMVQLPERCADGTEAAKAGYKNICEIGKERIRRAGEKIKAEIEEQNAQLKIDEEPKKVPDIGFKVFKLDSSNLKQWQPDYDDLETTLFDSISNYVEGRSELDVVYEIMLKMGMELTWPLETHTIGGKNVYEIGMGALMICLDDQITTEVAEGMAALYKELSPETWRVVFKDNGFADDSAKVNIKEILKTAGLEEDAFTTV